MTQNPRVITVDGTAGSGKTTLGSRLAAELDLPLVDTGLFYRAVTVAAVRAGIDESQKNELARLARDTKIEINTEPEPREWQVKVDGVDAGPLLRDPRNAVLLGIVSQTPEVRAALLDRQRQAAGRGAACPGDRHRSIRRQGWRP